MDTQEQQHDANSRHWTAEKAYTKLVDEISALKPGDVTSLNALFIAGLLLGREAECAYLLEPARSEFYYDRPEAGEPSERNRKDDLETRKEAGKLQEAIIKAKQGDFSGMRMFIAGEAQTYESMGQHIKGPNKLQATSVVLNRINELIPPAGDGSKIMVPNPAWIEEPAPLKIQLERLEQGGDN
jgi:hypothetical protein